MLSRSGRFLKPSRPAWASLAHLLAGLEDDVQLRAIRPPGLEVVVAHRASDGLALVLLLVELEVLVRNPCLVEAQRLARVLDYALNRRLRCHAHARPHANRRIGHKYLADL